MAPPRKSKLAKPLPDGFIVMDTEKKLWRLGRIIGQGGFGLIYLASQDVTRPVAEDTDFVIKIEYQENGPLFSELKFYQRAAKPESMQRWRRNRKLAFLGIPTYWGSGLAEYNDLRYRFMAMDRLGSDLQRVCDQNGGRLKKATVLQLGGVLVDVLEYIHENEYVHADIKAANLMLGYRDHETVYLADYGLSYRYCPDGVHKEYKENPKKGHNGTIEYTSLDAHKGLAPSRRGDLQILGFCLLHWLCGSLPWDSLLKNPSQVQEAKARLMNNLPDSVQHLSLSGASTDEVADFLSYVKTLEYDSKPDYQHLKNILSSGVQGRLDFSVPQGPVGQAASKVADHRTGEKVSEGHDATFISQQKAGRARQSPKVKPVPTAMDKKEQEGMKWRPVPAGPTKPQSPQEKRVSPAVRRSLRPRAALNYKEDDDDDDEEEEEEETRPRPIPPCYLRGPPIGPQKTKQKPKPSEDRTVTTVRPEQWTHPRRRKHQATDCDTNSRAQLGEGPPPHRADYSHQQRSDPTAQDAGPTQRNGLLSTFVLSAVVFWLTLLAFKLLLKMNF